MPQNVLFSLLYQGSIDFREWCRKYTAWDHYMSFNICNLCTFNHASILIIMQIHFTQHLMHLDQKILQITFNEVWLLMSNWKHIFGYTWMWLERFTHTHARCLRHYSILTIFLFCMVSWKLQFFTMISHRTH